MAPATRKAGVSKRQAPLRSFTKVSKSSKTHSSAKILACEDLIKPVVQLPKTQNNAAKRKRSEVEHDTETEPDHTGLASLKAKKPKLQLPSPASSQCADDNSSEIDFSELSLENRIEVDTPTLPTILEDMKSLHKSFLKAFTIHIAHNGRSAPAELTSLINTITRLWKKRTVTKEDIQRMLALYEVGTNEPIKESFVLTHKNAPFKLNMAGMGTHLRHTVEYVGVSKLPQWAGVYDEEKLQVLYETEVKAAFMAQRNVSAKWTYNNISSFPCLGFALGVQTQVRREKASAARNQILGLSSKTQDRGLTTVTPKTEENIEAQGEKTPQALKSRTLSLFDRVRAKQLATSCATAPTTESILRHRAIGRINEVVDILRMKQQQRLGSMFTSSIHSSPGRVRSKVSFSMSQAINDIKGSLTIPIGDDEIRMGINILAKEIPGGWLTTFNLARVQTVTLNGPGMGGAEVKRILTEKERQ